MYSVPQRVNRLLASAGGLFLLLLSLMVTVDVLVRVVTGRPFTGVFELSRLFLLVSFSLAIVPVAFHDRNLTVDILSSNFTGPMRSFARFLDTAATLVVFGMIAWVGSSEWMHAWRAGFLQPGIIEIPTIIPLGFIIFGAAGVCATAVLRTLWPRWWRPEDQDGAAPGRQVH